METYEEVMQRLYIAKVTRLAKDEGRQEGHAEGQQKLLLRLLSRRFGTLPEAVTARVMNADHDELIRWFDRSLDAATLDDVFAAP